MFTVFLFLPAIPEYTYKNVPWYFRNVLLQVPWIFSTIVLPADTTVFFVIFIKYTSKIVRHYRNQRKLLKLQIFWKLL